MKVCSLMLLAAVTASGQCHGNGGQGRLRGSIPALGSVVTTAVSGLPGASYFVFASPDLAVTAVPGLGTVCLDVASPGFVSVYSGSLDASGSFAAPFPIPTTPPWGDLVYFLQGLVSDPLAPSGFALTNTLRKDYEVADSHVTLPAMARDRVGHTATHLPERDWIFHCGGAGDGTTEIYHALCRCFSQGPTMATPRSSHTATELADGRVLIVGGTSGQSDALSSCEIFDPATYTLQPAASLGTPRLQHRAARLADGRVLVVGGTMSGIQAPLGIWALGNVLDTAEIYDPISDTWSPAATPMSSRRTECELVSLPDDRVLVISGIIGESGGVFGSMLDISDTCEFFDPTTNAFSPGPFLGQGAGRFSHQASLRPDGSIVVTGGNRANFTLSLQYETTASTLILQQGSWSAGPMLPEPRSNHRQTVLPDGEVLLVGGLRNDQSMAVPDVILSASCLRFDGAAFHPLADLPSLRSDFGLATLNDGTVLVTGGTSEEFVTPFGFPLPVQVTVDAVSLYTPTP